MIRMITLLALNSFKEVVRHKFFYGIAVASLFLVAFGSILGPLSINEQSRIITDFSLFGVQSVLIVICIFFGSLSVTKDLEKKVLMTLIPKSISRSSYILGKFFGMSIVSFVALIIIGGFVLGLFYFYDIPIEGILVKAFWGIYLEALLILSASILFSSFASPFLVVCFSFGLFIIGHWINTFYSLIERSKSPVIQFISEYVLIIFPNLEYFNWRPHVVYQEMVPPMEVIFYSFYAFSWIGLILTISILSFNKKDLV